MEKTRNTTGKTRTKAFISTVCIAAVCAVLLAPDQAQAGYLDPGSGSTAVQWIVAAIASLGRMKRHFSDTLSKIFGK